MNEHDGWLWLCSLPELTNMQRSALLKLVDGSPVSLFQAPDSLFEESGSRALDWMRKVMQCRNERFLDKVKYKMDAAGVSFTAFHEKGFPMSLHMIEDRPYGLFHIGALPDTDIRTAAIIGARACSPYGRAAASRISGALGRSGVQIVSGMAAGIDSEAQRAALEAGTRSWAVLGCGADVCYPVDSRDLYLELRERGGIISEYPCGVMPIRFHFPQRNRIISGLASELIVVEARRKSGSLITADCALEQGKEVYAVPGPFGDESTSCGCNYLIYQGAHIAVSVVNLLDQMGLNPDKAELAEAARPHNGDEELLLRMIGYEPISLDELSRRSGFPIRRTASILLSLELGGAVREIGKNEFVRTG